MCAPCASPGWRDLLFSCLTLATRHSPLAYEEGWRQKRQPPHFSLRIASNAVPADQESKNPILEKTVSRTYHWPVANGKAKVAEHPTSAVPFRFWLWGQIFDLLRANGRYFLVCITILFSVYWFSGAVKSFAGQVTIANVTLRILADVIVKWSLTMTVSGLSVALYFRERKQNENTRERLTKRITELELRIDSGRSSCQLTSRGRTRKGDE